MPDGQACRPPHPVPRSPLSPPRSRAVSAAVLLAVSAGPTVTLPSPLPAQQAPPPSVVLGYDPVDGQRLPRWSEIHGYFESLARTSPRVRLDTIGRSTLDRPLVMATVSSEGNLRRLDELRGIQARLADPRRIQDEAELEDLVRRGRLVILVTAGTHPTEVGGPLAAMRLAHHLATSLGPRTTRVREEAVVLIVPAVNPDGVDIVADWYASTANTPWAGSTPPEVQHHYVGHDLNRDWYAFTQKETRALAEEVHGRWHPQVHHDLHQHEATGARYFVPPWLDPVEPNVDPLLVAAATSLGTRIQWSMLEEGRAGVSVAARYDAWSPSRSLAHYQAGVRILSETASARLARPVELGVDELEPTPGLDPRVSSWNHPVPWEGGRWQLSDIVSYMQSGLMATLSIAAGEREVWLGNFVRVGRRAVEGWPAWPEAWVLPAPETGRAERAGSAELVRILRTAGVEVRWSTDSFSVGGRVFGAGSYLVSMRQPRAAFAQAVLAPQEYPDRRGDPGQPPTAPYDVTAHNLPLLLGVEAVALYEAPTVADAPVGAPPPAPARRIPGLSDAPSVMVGLYRPWTAAPDEGWTRWLFDNYAVPYVSLTNEMIARDGPLRELSAVVIPSIPETELKDGRSAADVPPRYVGGLSGRHVSNLREFVVQGGTLVAWGESVGFVIDVFDLPVRNLLNGVRPADFYAPGAQVRLAVDTATTLGAGMPAASAALLEGGAAFLALDDAEMAVVARYGRGDVALSGWVIGPSWIAGRPAVVELSVGAGHVVLFGFRPQYRGQSMATWPLLFNSVKRRRDP